MKILVFSDSHGDVDSMAGIISKEKPDQVLHLGDHERDARALQARFPALDFRLVSGNTDIAPEAQTEQVFEADGVRFFMTHGHVYGVKNGLLRLKLKAQSVGAALALFGHTHQPLLEQSGGVWLLNPGRAGKKAGGSDRANLRAGGNAGRPLYLPDHGCAAVGQFIVL